MRCLSCNSEIQFVFKHAIAKNECPCCGKQIMDENTLSVVLDVENTILEEVQIGEDEAKKLATILVAKYLFNTPRAIGGENIDEEDIKISKSSSFKQIEQIKNTEIIETSKLLENRELTELEKEALLEQAVMEKYNMVSQSITPDSFDKEEEIDNISISKNEMSNIFDDQNSILEQERIARLMKQKQVINSGAGKIRRG